MNADTLQNAIEYAGDASNASRTHGAFEKIDQPVDQALDKALTPTCETCDAIDRDRVRDAFARYVEPYDAQDAKISLKIDHTLRVAALCERIARSIDLADDDVDLAWLCGMLHDIGRFEQIRIWGTFNDRASTSHAALGIRVLFDDGHLGDFVDWNANDSRAQLLRAAIATHSDFRLPPEIDQRTRTFCDILRDADKIDILLANSTHTVEQIFDRSEAEMRASKVSEMARKGFYEHRTLRRNERHELADYLVSYACFVFELVYHESLVIAREQGKVFSILTRPFDRKDTITCFREMRDHMQSWLDAAIEEESDRHFDGSPAETTQPSPNTSSVDQGAREDELASAHAKLEALRTELAGLGSIAVSFSGGVDSTFLLAVAHEALGDQVVAFTATSPSFPKRELDEATAFCISRGIKQVVFETKEFDIEGFSHNPTNRCYLCKRELLGMVKALAAEHGLKHVTEGSNLDDLGQYRPGRRAVEEARVKSPLLDAGLTKREIRLLSQEMGLPTWDKQSFACLASRFAYGDEITREKLAMIDAAEQFMLDQGFTTVRVRIQDKTARIEIDPSQFQRVLYADLREQIVRRLREIGFAYVCLDLVGYRTGSMDETLPTS